MFTHGFSEDCTLNKNKVNLIADEVKSLKDSFRNDHQTFTVFSKTNPAYYPSSQEDEIKFLYSYHDVRATFKKLKNKTSSGLDKIPSIVLKNLPDLVIRDYTIIFNNAINNYYFPTRWKTAKVLPIPKKRNLESPQSDRPISLTTSISKVFERIIKKQLDIVVFNEKIVPENEFGFKAGHATTHAIHKFISDISHSLRDNLIVSAVLLDQEKAFDSVWINGLIYILVSNNFPMGLVLLLLDMLTGNHFHTWDGKLLSSDCFMILEGLQQGKVLSLILFYIYDRNTDSTANLN